METREKEYEKMRKNEKIYLAVFSILLSFSITVGNRAVFGGDVTAGLEQNYFQSFKWYDIFIFLLLAAGIWLLMGQLRNIQKKLADYKECDELSSVQVRKVYLFSCLLVLLAWFPYILSLAPGSVLEDSLDSIAQVLEPSVGLNNHHPVVYTLLVGIFVKAGIFVGNINIGVFMYSIVQTMIMIGTIGYVFVIMYKRNVPKWIGVLTLAWYMFMPVFPDYAMIMWKDPIFSCALMWLCFLLLELAEHKDKIVGWNWTLRYAGGCLAIAFFRNNGIYVVVLTSIIVLLAVRKRIKRFLMIILGILIMYCGITGTLYDRLGIKTEFVESVGIPLQQLAAVIENNGELSEEDREFLYRLLPEEEWKNSYAPCLVDTIKWNPHFDADYLEENKAEFIRVWISGLTKNLPEYVKAYGMETLGFWKLGVQDEYGYNDTYISENGYGIHRTDLLEKMTGVSLGRMLGDFRVYIGSGTLFWLIFATVVLIIIKREGYWIVGVPALGNWLTTMIAAPVAFSLRYVFIFMLGLPLFLILPLFKVKIDRGYDGDKYIVVGKAMEK